MFPLERSFLDMNFKVYFNSRKKYSPGDLVELFFPNFFGRAVFPTKRMEEAWFAGAFNNEFIRPVSALKFEAADRVATFRSGG